MLERIIHDLIFLVLFGGCMAFILPWAIKKAFIEAMIAIDEVTRDEKEIVVELEDDE